MKRETANGGARGILENTRNTQCVNIEPRTHVLSVAAAAINGMRIGQWTNGVLCREAEKHLKKAGVNPEVVAPIEAGSSKTPHAIKLVKARQELSKALSK